MGLLYCSGARFWEVQVCHRCLASMGRKNPSMVYTDPSDTAAWRRSEYFEDPWTVPPSLSNLTGFSLQTVSWDLLHLWHRGCSRDLIGSAFKLMCRQRGLYYHASNIEGRLGQLAADIKVFAAAQNKSVTFKKLTKTTLVWKGGCCPELHASAADAGLCLAFLVSKLEEIPMGAPYDGLLGCVWAAHHMVAMLMNGNFFLSQEERDAVHTVGNVYLVTYAKLASMAHSRGEFFFKVRPKYHMMTHLLSDVLLRGSGRNPSVDACWVDEDFVKYMLRIYRKVSRRKASLNLLKRMLVVQKQRLESKA